MTAALEAIGLRKRFGTLQAANDVTLSPDGGTIYVSGADGNVYAYSAESGDLLHAWHVGESLGGIDVSFDGSFSSCTASVIEGHSSGVIQRKGPNGVVYKITGGSTTAPSCSIQSGNAFGG